MTKYCRVRTPEQWDWLKNKLEIEDDLHVSNFPVTILYDDVICGIYRQDEVASKLSTPKHKITHQSMQTLFKKYDMQKARQTLKRRSRARYLVKDGKTKAQRRVRIF